MKNDQKSLDKSERNLKKLESNLENIITKACMSKEWDLIIDEVAPDIYTWPLFTIQFCSEMITMAEQHEWTRSRHKFYPTTDMLLENFGMSEAYHSILREYVYPAAVHKWKLEGTTWEELSFESFIIKYTPGDQSHLSLHHDHSKITAITTLNDDFEGGGTYFERQNFLLTSSPGHMSIHPGSITHRHGARSVTKGVRYVIVTFST